MSTETHQAFDQFSEYAEVAHLAGRSLAELIAEVQEVYLMVQRPWVVGFSGGKDSAAMLLRLLEMEQEAIERGEEPQYPVTGATFADTTFEMPELIDYIKMIESICALAI